MMEPMRLAAVVLLGALVGLPHAKAQQQDLRKFLVGTWRLPTHDGYNDAFFRAGGSFKITIHQKGSREQAYLSGAWEIRRGNQLWTHNLAWYPIYVRHFDGTRTRVQIPAWESTTVQIVDADHIKTGSGIAARVKQ